MDVVKAAKAERDRWVKRVQDTDAELIRVQQLLAGSSGNYLS